MSRARDLASSGVTSTVLSAKAPLASPDFTGTVDLTGTTISLDNDQISGDKISGGTIGGSTFNGTIGDSATFPTGSVLQVKNVLGSQENGSGGIVLKYMEVSLTTRSSNSDFLIMCNVNWGQLGNILNMDPYDICFAMAYKLASAADSAYVGISSNRSAFDRRTFTGTNIGQQAWYCTDVPWAPNRTDTHTGGYDTFNQSFVALDQTKSLSDGTAIKFACYVDAYDTYYIGRSRATTGSGGMSSLTVMEIKNV